MKKARLLIALLCAALGVGMLTFAACKPEETSGTQTATLTLSAGEGGTLAQTTYEVEVGTSLSDYLKNIAPTPEEGLTFAGWYHADDLLASEQMPAGGYTLTAKYNASLTVNVYLESAEGTYGEPKVLTATSIYGEAFSYNPVEEHFVLDESKENRLSAEKLGKSETFTAYMKRETYAINYYANAPEGETVEGSVLSATVRYGQTYSLPDGEGFTAEAWLRFAGWATEANGPLVYRAGEEISPEHDLFLHAVWDKAYFDGFGGSDFIFFPQTEAGVALLLRAGKEYRGEVLGNSTAEETSFSFKEGEREILKGKAYKATGTFVYYREAQEGAQYLHGDAYSYGPHEDGATIEFDSYGAVIYTVGETVKKGEVSYDPETMCYTFRSGEEGFRFMLTEMTVSGESRAVFVTIGAEEGVYEYLNFYYQDGEIKEFGELYPVLNGMGYMEIYNGNAELVYMGIYHPEERGKVNLFLVNEEEESIELVAKLLAYQNGNIMLIQDGYEGTYTSEEDGTLVLDGFSGTNESAVYTDANGTAKKGMYAFDLTTLGGMLLRFREESGGITTFRIDKETHSLSLLGDGDYKEYLAYYGNAANSALGTTTLLLGENNSASLYIDGEEETEGIVTTVQGSDGLFLFTAEDSGLVFQYKLDEGDFLIDGFRYHCNYFIYYPVYNSENEAMRLFQMDDGGSLLVDAQSGAAVYTKGNVSSVGFFYNLSDSGVDFDGHTYLEFLDVQTNERSFFEIVDVEETSRAVLLGEESGYYDLYADGIVDENSFLLLLSGEDKIAFYRDGEGSDHLGTFEYDPSTGYGTFTYGTDTEHSELRFVLPDTDGSYCFALHNGLWEEDEKIFLGEEGHSLELNAYGQGFYDGSAIEYIVLATSKDENTRRIYVLGYTDTSYFDAYFDIDVKNGTYTACGYEVGQYYEAEKREDVLYFDGYGKVTRHNIRETEADGETLKTLEEGTYTVLDLDEGIILIQMGGKSYTIHVYGLADAEGDVIYYYTEEFEGAGTYYGENWEVVTLSPYGEAVFTDRYGISYEGEYSLLSEHGVSFVSSWLDGTQIFLLGQNNSFTHPTSGLIIDGDVLVKYLGGSEKEITVPAGVKTVAPLAFSEFEYGSRYRGADITSIDLNEVVEVGDNAFNGCTELTSVKGAHVKTVGANAFYGCIELASFELPRVEVIGENAFHLCESLTAVTLSSAKTVYSSAFSGCYELVRVELPAAEALYEGVFYDCFALETVVLGEKLTLLGTPDEAVAGVFERSYDPEQQPLTVVLRGTTPPTVGLDLFTGVSVYTVLVPNIETVKAFYQNEGWAAYNANLGCESAYDGTYYRYQYSATAFVLNGVLREIDYGVTVLGAYYVENNIFHLLKFDSSAESNYTDTERGVFQEGVLLYDRYSYGIDEENYGLLYRYYKAGTKLTLTVNSDDEAKNDTIAFTPAAIEKIATGLVYEVEAEWTKEGEKKAAKVRLQFDQYYSSTLYLTADGYRYSMSPNVNADSATVSLGSPVFDPVVTIYTASDESYLALSQNDEEGTNYTATVVLTGIRDDEGSPLTLTQIAVEKGADGNTFTAKESHVFAGYSYKFTFTIAGETFTYSYERERRIVVTSADGVGQVVLYQAASGEITSVTLSVNGTEIGEAFANKLYTHENGSNVYHWLVYDYNYAGDFTLTLTGTGDALSGTLTSGTVVKGYLDGVYVIAFYVGDSRTALYMRDQEDVYEKIAESAIEEEDGYLTVTFQESTYYVTIDVVEKTVKIVFADMTYESNSWDDIKGSVRLVRNPDGSIASMTLTIEDKTYTKFIAHEAESETYYIFTDDENTVCYYVTLSTSNSNISLMGVKTCTLDKLKLTLLSGPDGELKDVVNATYDGKEVKVNFFPFYDYNIGECAWLEVITAEGTKYFYRASVATGTIETREGAILTTEDGAYRVTIVFENEEPATALHLEVKQGESYVEIPISWCGAADYGDGYNYEIDDTDNIYYYFNIVFENGVWSITFHHKN